MRVHHGADILTHLIYRKMHPQLRTRVSFAGKLLAVKIADHQIAAREHALTHSCRSDQNPPVREAHGNITVARGNPPAVEAKLPDSKDPGSEAKAAGGTEGVETPAALTASLQDLIQRISNLEQEVAGLRKSQA